MQNEQFFSGRSRSRDSSNAREQRQRHFVMLDILIGVLLAVAFGLILYSMNVSRRI